jgi:hypothetical protein
VASHFRTKLIDRLGRRCGHRRRPLKRTTDLSLVALGIGATLAGPVRPDRGGIAVRAGLRRAGFLVAGSGAFAGLLRGVRVDDSIAAAPTYYATMGELWWIIG